MDIWGHKDKVKQNQPASQPEEKKNRNLETLVSETRIELEIDR